MFSYFNNFLAAGHRSGADPGEVKWVNFHPSFYYSEPFLFFLLPQILKEYSDILFEVINYRWVQILETYNSSPRISKKIKITDRGGVRRKSLNKFKKYLSLTDKVCFISGEEFDGDVSIDHMIPWSFMFSDDLWNLVYVKRGYNSSKSNRIVDESEIIKLEERNKDLVRKMESKGMIDKNYFELKFSIENNLLRKFWISFKG